MSIYRSPEGKAEIMTLYDSLLSHLGVEFEDLFLDTRFGETHVLTTGPRDAPPLVILQGGNVVNPVSLSWFVPLARRYRIYAPDTIGHPGKSAQTRISPTDESYGRWVVDLLDRLGLGQTPLLGPSYGAGIILRTAVHAPERVSKAVLIVPSGIASGSMRRMVLEIALPMLRYRISPSRERLRRAVCPMFTEEPEEDVLRVIGAVFRNVRLETRLPKHTTADELAGFEAPTMVLAAENDIFFPADKVLPRAREIILNFAAYECLEGAGHFPSGRGLARINESVRAFLG